MAEMAEVDDAFHGEQTTAANKMSKRWCLTVFDDVWTPTFTPEMAFAVWQRETCPRTGRLHVHIYVRFIGRKRMSSVKNCFARQDMHCEPARGSEEQATAYCEKDAGRAEVGARWGTYDANEGKQGRRSDLELIARRLRDGEPVRVIAEEHPGDFIRYHAGINAMFLQVAPVPAMERDVQILVLWGATGTGKTHRIMHEYPNCYKARPGRDPWGNYRGEECVFFDEFDWSRWPLDDMKEYLDKWRVLLDARYNNRYAAWTHVAICANSCPTTWYPNSDMPSVQALRRRIATCCYKVTSQEQALEDMENTPTF